MIAYVSYNVVYLQSGYLTLLGQLYRGTRQVLLYGSHDYYVEIGEGVKGV